jgi:hypothetical protein
MLGPALLWHLALQSEQSVRKLFRVREGDQMSSRKHVYVRLKAVPGDASLELEWEEAVPR